MEQEAWQEHREDLQKQLAEAEELESQFAAGQEPPGSDSLTRKQVQATIALISRMLATGGVTSEALPISALSYEDTAPMSH